MLEMTFCVMLLTHCMHAGDDILCRAAHSLYACWVLLTHCMHAGDDILCRAAHSLYACGR